MKWNEEKSSQFGVNNAKINDAYQVMYNIINEGFNLDAIPKVLNSGVSVSGESRKVYCSVLDKKGDVVRSFDNALPIKVQVSTVGDGDATIVEDNNNLEGLLFFKDGRATVEIRYTGAWAENDICTLTLGNTSKIAGVSVENATSTDTILASIFE